jgi:membrane protease YdiL (CAAX protease family)
MRIFVSNGTIRPLWRVVVFIAIGYVIQFAVTPLFGYLGNRYPSLNALSPQAVILGEAFILIAALIGTAIWATYEHRRIDNYGLPLDQALSRPFWDGVLVGLAGPGLVGLGMLALHGWVIHGVNLQGSEWLVFPFVWLIANVVVGLSEEAWYRAYALQTLTKSLGFWPAAIVLSLMFTADHYFFKPGENIWDVISLFALGFFICLSVRRTGALWFGVGFHIAFDFVQLFVIGTPNGGQLPVGRLFVSSFPGPAWVNGGALGTEASALMYPVIAAMYVYLLVRYPKDQALTS